MEENWGPIRKVAMSVYKNPSICAVAICLVATAVPSALADLLPNGSFENVTAGTFASWAYMPGTTGGLVATASTSPSVLDGTYSAAIQHGSTNGGRLWQQVSSTGATDFMWECDFAVLPISSGSRTLSVLTYSDTLDSGNLSANNVDSIRVNASNQLEFYSLGWHNTGLTALVTPDTGTLLEFDGETPVMNHLTFVASGYGTADQGFTITLNGASSSDSGAVSNNAIRYFAFAGHLSTADYVVDNASFAIIPEPSVFALFACGIWTLLAPLRRRRRQTHL